MGRVITSPGVLKNVQGQIDHVTDMYDDIKDNNLKPLTVTLDPISNANGAYSHITEDERITEDMKAVTLEVGTPECFRAPVTISTANGSATVLCADAHGNSTITVTFVKTSPVTGGADYPPAVTSTEFDILADRIGALTDLNTTDKSSIVNAVNEVIDSVGDVNSKFSVYELASGQQLKTVAVDTSICPANSVRWLNLRNGSTTGLPNNNALYGMARVNRRNANTIQITTLADNGESFETHSADGGSTWSEWYNAIGSLNSKINIKGTLGGDVITAINNANMGITFYKNSNSPNNRPSGCDWGAYYIIKDSSKSASVIYIDNDHIACTYSVDATTSTSITWYVGAPNRKYAAKAIAAASDANSTIDLSLDSSVVVVDVHTPSNTNVICLPYLHNNTWRARLINATTGAPLSENTRNFHVHYYTP